MTDTSTDPRNEFMWHLTRWHERTYGSSRVTDRHLDEYIQTLSPEQRNTFLAHYLTWYMNQHPDLVRRYHDAPSDSVQHAVFRRALADSVAGHDTTPHLIHDSHTDDLPWLRYQSSFCLPHEQADHEARLAADPDVRLVWRIPDADEDDLAYAVGVRRDRDHDYRPGHYPTEAALVEHYPHRVHPRQATP